MSSILGDATWLKAKVNGWFQNDIRNRMIIKINLKKNKKKAE